ncbi:MAG TPA: ABC transporter family substrate-binding protein [Pseudonocardiaceae bacterium]|jgi:peptide/nickel transport system substrate-binding protein|nr:ABC transporter family substrate-binding protein [Pseudonocardiaceae bacterium]
MRRTRAFSAIALIAGAVVALAGCSGTSGDSSGGAANNGPTNADPNALAVSQPYTRPKVPSSGTVSVAVDEAYTNYNNNLSATNNIANLYINNLIQLQPFFTNDVNNVTKVQLDADLMSSAKLTSTSPQVAEFDINPKAVWSDGVPVTCDDFRLLWLSNYNQTGPLATAFSQNQPGFDHVSNVACSNNDKTATVTFKENWADWIGLFPNLLPAHVLEKAVGLTSQQFDALSPVNPNAADTATLMKVATFWSGGPNGDQPGFIGLNPQFNLSDGPYMIKSADGKTETVLVRNPKWWGNPAGPSELDVRTNTDDQSAYQQLQNKEIQVAAGQPDAQVAQEANASGGQYKLITGIGLTFEHLDYQFKNAVFQKYPELRKALSMCVNRTDIINKVVADVDPAVKPLGSVLFLPTEAQYKDHYTDTGLGNETQAKKILTDAGWTMGPNGFLTKNGQTATITIGHKTNDRRESTVQAIQAECKQAGIQVNDFSSDGFNGKDLPAGNYQVALFAWTGSPYKSGLTPIYTSPSAGGGNNFQNYSDPKVDQLLRSADGELTYTTRLQDLQQADTLMAQDNATLPLYTLPEYAVTDGSLTSTDASGKKVSIQDNEAASGVLWDAYAWQPTS